MKKCIFQLQENIDLELIPRKAHYTNSFVIPRITLKHRLGIIFSKTSFQLSGFSEPGFC